MQQYLVNSWGAENDTFGAENGSFWGLLTSTQTQIRVLAFRSPFKHKIHHFKCKIHHFYCTVELRLVILMRN